MRRLAAPENLNAGLPQNRTEALMTEGLQRLGVEVGYGVAVETLEAGEADVSATFSNGASKRYDWAIGADGVRSSVREALGIGYHGYDLPGLWSVADVDVGPASIDHFTAWIQGEGGLFVFAIPIAERRLRLASSAPDVMKRLPVGLDVVNVRRSGTFALGVRQAETYRKGRALLAGDAAHCHSPVGGRGMNLGIDDAVRAAEAILRDDVDAYVARQHALGARVMAQSERGRRFVMAEDMPRRLATWATCQALQRSTWLQRRFLKMLGTL